MDAESASQHTPGHNTGETASRPNNELPDSNAGGHGENTTFSQTQSTASGCSGPSRAKLDAEFQRQIVEKFGGPLSDQVQTFLEASLDTLLTVLDRSRPDQIAASMKQCRRILNAAQRVISSKLNPVVSSAQFTTMASAQRVSDSQSIRPFDSLGQNRHISISAAPLPPSSSSPSSPLPPSTSPPSKSPPRIQPSSFSSTASPKHKKVKMIPPSMHPRPNHPAEPMPQGLNGMGYNPHLQHPMQGANPYQTSASGHLQYAPPPAQSSAYWPAAVPQYCAQPAAVVPASNSRATQPAAQPYMAAPTSQGQWPQTHAQSNWAPAPVPQHHMVQAVMHQQAVPQPAVPHVPAPMGQPGQCQPAAPGQQYQVPPARGNPVAMGPPYPMPQGPNQGDWPLHAAPMPDPQAFYPPKQMEGRRGQKEEVAARKQPPHPHNPGPCQGVERPLWPWSPRTLSHFQRDFSRALEDISEMEALPFLKKVPVAFQEVWLEQMPRFRPHVERLRWLLSLQEALEANRSPRRQGEGRQPSPTRVEKRLRSRHSTAKTPGQAAPCGYKPQPAHARPSTVAAPRAASPRPMPPPTSMAPTPAPLQHPQLLQPFHVQQTGPAMPMAMAVAPPAGPWTQHSAGAAAVVSSAVPPPPAAPPAPLLTTIDPQLLSVSAPVVTAPAAVPAVEEPAEHSVPAELATSPVGAEEPPPELFSTIDLSQFFPPELDGMELPLEFFGGSP